MRALLANLGFVLQISGLFILLPIGLAFAYGELAAALALLVTAMAFLALGFSFNALCERRELSYKQSCSLIVLAFILLSLIGAIPYFYLNVSGGDVVQNLTDSIFESASGFTTTGFSVFPDIESVPQSIIFYRAMTQFIGGIGIVLILLAFFYPDAKLKDFSRGMGFGKNEKIRHTFLLILLIYCSYTIIMTALSFVLGYRDPLTAVSLVFAALSTGGFAPANDLGSVAGSFPMNAILIVSMTLGATNFFVLAGLFKRRVRDFFLSEFSVFIIVSLIAIIGVVALFQLSVFDSTFTLVSAMTTTGFSFLPVVEFSDGLKLVLVMLMFVGGASFSTAGGVKIFRLMLMLKAVRKSIVSGITKKDVPVRLFGRTYGNEEIIQAVALMFLMAGFIFLATIALSLYGFAPVDAMFEATSAMATTGLSTGVVSPTLAGELKWMLIGLMVLGRVEIIAFLTIFSRAREPI